MEIKKKISSTYGTQTFFAVVAHGARVFCHALWTGHGFFKLTFCKYFQPVPSINNVQSLVTFCAFSVVLDIPSHEKAFKIKLIAFILSGSQ